MNAPRTIEAAIADIIREYAVGPSTVIRCWHVLRNDHRWVAETDRTFPCIDIRCAAPSPGDTPSTLRCEVSILVATKTEDDRDHAQIDANEEAVQTALDTLFSQSRRGRGGALWTALTTAFNADCTPAVIGGLQFGQSTAPYDDEGRNVVGMQLVVHYSRPDFN